VARIYDDLGFNEAGLNAAATALTINPASAAAHRFLSDLYQGEPRHEVARVSELLQAQLLQPLGTYPTQPSLPFADLGTVSTSYAGRPSFNEYAPLFAQDGVSLIASGEIGSDWMRADELVATALFGRGVLSAGQYHFHTDGFRKNADLEHDIYNLFGQFELSDALDIQAEYRGRNTDQGDVTLDFSEDPTSTERRRKIDQDVGRLGLRYTLA
jgi:hypothetical protein